MCGHKTEKVVSLVNVLALKRTGFSWGFQKLLFVLNKILKANHLVLHQPHPILIRPQILEPCIFKDEVGSRLTREEKTFFCKLFVNHTQSIIKAYNDNSFSIHLTSGVEKIVFAPDTATVTVFFDCCGYAAVDLHCDGGGKFPLEIIELCHGEQ